MQQQYRQAQHHVTEELRGVQELQTVQKSRKYLIVEELDVDELDLHAQRHGQK
jgi:hypothetical protein